MKLTWDEAGSRLFETGVSKAVLYPTDPFGRYSNGVAWSGLTSITVSPEGDAPTPIYANNVKIGEYYSFLDINGTIEAFTYPDEFSDCIRFVEAKPGMRYAMQRRKRFGLAWQSRLGNEVNGIKHGYKLHILYGCMAQLSELQYSTINADPDLMTFSWPFSTLPAIAPGFFNTSYVEIDSTKTNPDNLFYLEQVLYGTDWTDAELPYPAKLNEIMTDREDSMNGIFAVLDDTAYPYSGKYSNFVEGIYPKLDILRF